MIVNIAELDADAGARIPFAFETTAESIDAISETCTFETPIVVKGTVLGTGMGCRVEGVIECRRTFACDRCLELCSEGQCIEFSEEFRREADETEDGNLLSGDEIELEDMVRDTLLAAQPLSNICKPDCKGLCPVCGENLNKGDCGCNRFVPDPRLAALQQWKKEME